MTMLLTAFGENWTQYLQAAIFSYNAAICRRPGFSPYFLIHGRNPALLEEITLPSPFAGDKALNQPITDMNSITKRLKAAFKFVATQQERVPLQNRKARETNAKIVEYEVNDHVMYWEPSQPKHLAFATNAAQMGDDSDVARRTAHRSWKCRWTGPLRITSHSVGECN
jgi:hypothetical protein